MTANGTEISDGASLSGSQVLRVYGSNLTPPYFSLMFNGVEYTPLDYGEGYVEYVLQDNGTYEIRNERDVVMEFSISGVIVPDILPTYIAATLTNSPSAVSDSNHNKGWYIQQSTNCLNFAQQCDSEWPYIILQIRDHVISENDVIWHNVSSSRYRATEDRTYWNLTPNESNDVIWGEYGSFIIFVGNYTTTT